MCINVSAFDKYVESQLTLNYVRKLIFIGSLIFLILNISFANYNIQKVHNKEL